MWAFARQAARRETLLVRHQLLGRRRRTSLDLSAFAVTGGRSAVRDVLSGRALADLTAANQSAYALSLPAYGWRILNAAVTPVPAPPSTLDGRDIPADFGGGTLVATQNDATGMGDNVNELDQMYARAESAAGSASASPGTSPRTAPRWRCCSIAGPADRTRCAPRRSARRRAACRNWTAW